LIKIKPNVNPSLGEHMSQAPHHHDDQHGEVDVAESIVGVIPWVLPTAGAVLIFLLAFIAVVFGA